ncbi:MAG TPA: YkgJ family cysteine cluster protein [Deltaproteobacteria bacterium]|nr:YkgJ family cysteine cluster protein [Deltaproteobacteria bacterium]
MELKGSIEKANCERCGECCLRSSPALQTQDISFVSNGLIQWSHLYTVRIGEPVRNNIDGTLEQTQHEIIKVREKTGKAECLFYDDAGKACTIYDHRPIQCAAQACWDEREFFRVYAEPKATRQDIIRDKNLLRLVSEHEKRCAYTELDRGVRRIETDGNRALEKILALLKFDHDLRRMAPEKLGMDPAELDFVFGRPLTDAICLFGLKVMKEKDGSFFLTISDSKIPA